MAFAEGKRGRFFSLALLVVATCTVALVANGQSLGTFPRHRSLRCKSIYLGQEYEEMIVTISCDWFYCYRAFSRDVTRTKKRPPFWCTAAIFGEAGLPQYVVTVIHRDPRCRVSWKRRQMEQLSCVKSTLAKL